MRHRFGKIENEKEKKGQVFHWSQKKMRPLFFFIFQFLVFVHQTSAKSIYFGLLFILLLETRSERLIRALCKQVAITCVKSINVISVAFNSIFHCLLCLVAVILEPYLNLRCG